MDAYTPPLEVILPLERRDEIRARVLAKAPGWYNPYLHLAMPSAFAIVVIAVALSMIHNLTALQLLAVPIFYLVANANEWRIHRDLLHRRFPPAALLYDRHTPEHHMIYVTDDMAMRD